MDSKRFSQVELFWLLKFVILLYIPFFIVHTTFLSYQLDAGLASGDEKIKNKLSLLSWSSFNAQTHT